MERVEPTDDRRKAPLSSRWTIVFDLALVCATGIGGYWKLIFTSTTINVASPFSDWCKLAQPAYTYTGRSLVRGELPLWNTHWFAGYPHLAAPSNSVF